MMKYDVSGPRYTSYPTALQFSSSFKANNYRQIVTQSNYTDSTKPLSLYIHIPFCESLCYYCGCHKVITKNKKRSEIYLHALQKEIALQGKLFNKNREVRQVHLGGGTPTFLTAHQIRSLIECIKDNFVLAPLSQCEIGIEIDPRTTNSADISSLAEIGFNRMSFGIQDFDEQVQIAMNRIQSKEQTLQLLQAVRASKVESLSVDLIYGLPKQNIVGFKDTLTTMIKARPDRIALYNYAHMPSLIKSQKLIKDEHLLSAEEKLALLKLSVESLVEAGYCHIGMDHFALPEDPLSISLENGTLHRNFQGYSTNGDCDVIGLGVSAISKINGAFAQNHKSLPDYQNAISHHELATQRGYLLSEDDKIRADIIQHLMCSHILNFNDLGAQYKINFKEYFNHELIKLEAMGNDGLITIDQDTIKITDRGRLLLRNIAMVFDKYLRSNTSSLNTIKYSKVL